MQNQTNPCVDGNILNGQNMLVEGVMVLGQNGKVT